MLVDAPELLDWIADREALLIAAWTPQIAVSLAWDQVVAEVLAGELHAAMVTTFDEGGVEQNFLNLVTRGGSGLPPMIERQVARRFFNGTLMLARAASHHANEAKSRRFLPFKRGVVISDGWTDPRHLPLAQILLPADHSFWLRWNPPFGLECRCSTRLMTADTVERDGLSVTTPLDLAWIETRLHDDWPDAFRPLLDFRQPVVPASEPPSELKLTKDQYAGVLHLFGSGE